MSADRVGHVFEDHAMHQRVTAGSSLQSDSKERPVTSSCNYNMTAQRLIGSVLLLLLFLSMIFSYAVGKYNMYILTFQLTLLSGSKFCENRKTMLTFLGRVKTCDLKLTCEQI